MGQFATMSPKCHQWLHMGDQPPNYAIDRTLDVRVTAASFSMIYVRVSLLCYPMVEKPPN
jgi:hypothetical protein